MWDDIIIGEGDKGNSAFLLRKVEEEGGLSISHNSVSYWVRHSFLDLGMTIFKDSEDGKELTALLDECCTDEVLISFMDDVALNNLSTERLKERIVYAIKEGFEEGRRFQAAQIREALGYE